MSILRFIAHEVSTPHLFQNEYKVSTFWMSSVSNLAQNFWKSLQIDFSDLVLLTPLFSYGGYIFLEVFWCTIHQGIHCFWYSRFLGYHLVNIRSVNVCMGPPKRNLKIALSRRFFARTTPRNCLKLMSMPSSTNHAESQVHLSRNNAILFIQFPFSHFEIYAITPSRFPLGPLYMVAK